MSEEELDDLSMPEEIGETDSQDEMYEHFSVTVDKVRACCGSTNS